LALKDNKKIRIYPINGESFDIGNWDDAESTEKRLNNERNI
jgi:hypothetical protein